MKLFFMFMLISLGAIAAPTKSAKNFFKDKTTIENPFNLRDPFKAPQSKSEGKTTNRGFNVTGKGQYSNIADTNLDQISVTDIKVIGVLIGKERRAMIDVSKAAAASGSSPVPGGGAAMSKSKVMVLKEGMKIGAEGAELKAILPGGIVLVEKIVNVYGEEEYLETVIPISR
jgi:type IV pilus assembly protein PilP